MTELYVRYSHFNFTPAQWKEAAERYIELVKAWDELADQDIDVDHDALADNFERCEICDQMTELVDAREDFAKKFALVWAEKVLEGKS